MEVIILVRPLRIFIRMVFFIYQTFLSPLFQLAFNAHCRYEESCSRYTERMILERGLGVGIRLGAKRILSCNQWDKFFKKS